MKKLLIGLIILFSFLFINNVNASILNSTFVVSENIFDDEAYRKTFINTYNGYNTYYDALINSDKYELFNNQIQNYNHKYYIYTSNRVYMWDDENLKVNAHALKVSSSNSVLGFSLSNTIINGNSTYYYTDISDYLTKGTISNKAVSFSSPIGLTLGMHSIDKSDSGWFYSSYIYNNKNLDYYYFIGFNTNTNIYFSTLRNSYYSSGSHYNKISVGGITYNDNDIIYEYNSEPQLEYKTGFISSEAYSVLGKVTNNFSIDSDLLEYRNYKFKLQFGSNDFTNENIPVFSHYKIFGLNRGTNNYESLDKYLNENFFTLDIIDTTYDYSEGMLADASIALQLNYYGSDEELEIFNTLYSQIKLEFYLDNTQNGYIYCYDNLLTSKWEDTSKFLEDYIYYYFPSNYKYAFITSDNNINEGKIYFPTNSINNDLVKIQGQYYNIKNKKFSFPIVTNLYLNDNYYSYFNFYFNDNENILLLNRAVGSYTYTSYYNINFLEFWSNLINDTLGNSILDNYSISEDTYFYVPIGYNVYFTNNTNITIGTSNGNIDIDIENTTNDYENNIYNENIIGNSFFDLFIKSFNYFISPINNLFSLISLFFSILPIGIQYMFYVSFGFIIALLIYKFVL